MKKDFWSFKYPIPIPCAFPIPICNSLPTPKEKQKLVCNDICGNFLLSDNITLLEVWEKKLVNPLLLQSRFLTVYKAHLLKLMCNKTQVTQFFSQFLLEIRFPKRLKISRPLPLASPNLVVQMVSFV